MTAAVHKRSYLFTASPWRLQRINSTCTGPWNWSWLQTVLGNLSHRLTEVWSECFLGHFTVSGRSVLEEVKKELKSRPSTHLSTPGQSLPKACTLGSFGGFTPCYYRHIFLNILANYIFKCEQMMWNIIKLLNYCSSTELCVYGISGEDCNLVPLPVENWKQEVSKDSQRLLQTFSQTN